MHKAGMGQCGSRSTCKLHLNSAHVKNELCQALKLFRCLKYTLLKVVWLRTSDHTPKAQSHAGSARSPLAKAREVLGDSSGERA